MKKVLILTACIFSICAQAQQKLNRFHLVDQESGLAIPSVSVAILKAKLLMTTEKDGIFIIPGDLKRMQDTILFYVQNYSSLKMPLRELSNVDTIRLRKNVYSGNNKMKTFLKNDTLLNDYNRLDITYYAGLHNGDNEFQYLQLAEQFDVPRTGMFLKNVVINRLAFYQYYLTQYENTELEYTKFRIRLYDVDAINGGPGKDLCNEIIEVKSSDQKQKDINLKNYNIVIPNKTFFVAVEWLRDYYNLGLVRIYNPGRKKMVSFVNFRPAIGISPEKGKKLNMWALNLNHLWKPYTTYSPDFTDLAIKAIVGY